MLQVDVLYATQNWGWCLCTAGVWYTNFLKPNGQSRNLNIYACIPFNCFTAVRVLSILILSSSILVNYFALTTCVISFFSVSEQRHNCPLNCYSNYTRQTFIFCMNFFNRRIISKSMFCKPQKWTVAHRLLSTVKFYLYYNSIRISPNFMPMDKFLSI